MPALWTRSAGHLYARELKRLPALPGDSWARVTSTQAGVGEMDIALVGGRIAPEFSRQRQYIGREVVGRVAAIGPEVTLMHQGDRVVLTGAAHATCATLNLQPPCPACAAGNVALCEHRAVPWAGTGAGWSEAMVVHESQLFLVPDVLTDDQAVLLEPAARAVRGVLWRVPEPGSSALVIGGNFMGLMLLAALKALAPNAQVTYAADAPHERKLAEAYAPHAVIGASTGSLLHQGAMQTNAQIFAHGAIPYILGGYSHIYDCAATHATVGTAIRLARSGGIVMLMGAPQRQITLDATLVQRDEVSLVGIAGAGMDRVPEDVKDGKPGRWSSLAVAARLMRKGMLKTDGFITHRFSARQVRQALRLAAEPQRHKVARALLTFGSKE
jgi:threonine dehydrogenase-like Zn-dependent dehydrogenase